MANKLAKASGGNRPVKDLAARGTKIGAARGGIAARGTPASAAPAQPQRGESMQIWGWGSAPAP